MPDEPSDRPETPRIASLCALVGAVLAGTSVCVTSFLAEDGERSRLRGPEAACVRSVPQAGSPAAWPEAESAACVPRARPWRSS